MQLNRRILAPVLAVGTVLAGIAHSDAAEIFFRYNGRMPTIIAAADPEEPSEPETPPEPENWLIFDFEGGIHAECRTEVTASDYAPSLPDFRDMGVIVWQPSNPYGPPLSYVNGDLEGRMGFQSWGDGVRGSDGTITLSIYDDTTAENGFGRTCIDGAFIVTIPPAPWTWPEWAMVTDTRIETR
jgi:hypothetical protein